LLLLWSYFKCHTVSQASHIVKQVFVKSTPKKEDTGPIEKEKPLSNWDETPVNKPMHYTLEDKIPKKVLPKFSQLVPKEEVKLSDYMYYVNDTGEGYPKFVDKKTNRIIKEYKPTCATLECPISGITPKDKEDYLQWLNEMSDTKYEAVTTDKGFLVKKMP